MECSLCCETFTEEGSHVPRNLDCGHTFCTVCIERLETHAPLRQGPRCPDCRAVIRFNRRTVLSLPKNFKLLELIREQRGAQKTQRTSVATDAQAHSYSSAAPCSTAMGMPAVPESRPRHGMMVMGSYIPPMITNLDELMHFRPLASRPVPLGSFAEDLTQLRIATSASEETVSRNRTPSVFPSAPSPEEHPAVPEAVENGRAVAGPNGTLVCKFFQEGTCRYGHHCWFQHPVHNENKSLCRHWMKGQCRMGLTCNFRHGTQRCVPPIRPPRQPSPQRDPSAPGPSGEGPRPPGRRTRPSAVVFVTGCGSTLHHPAPQVSQERVWGNLPTQAGAAGRSVGSESERFFDAFSSSFQQ